MGNNGQLNAAWPMDPSSLHSSIGCPGAVDLVGPESPIFHLLFLLLTLQLTNCLSVL